MPSEHFLEKKVHIEIGEEEAILESARPSERLVFSRMTHGAIESAGL
jgi:hypothetical protein